MLYIKIESTTILKIYFFSLICFNYILNVMSWIMSTEILDQPLTGIIDDVGFPSRVILFNDEWHSFDEVIEQVIKAINCSRAVAEDITWQVHNMGKAAVFEGEMKECLRVSSVLEEIALHTQIEC
jgi:ATP-dependent Clp protease adaptor protein ClpS